MTQAGVLMAEPKKVATPQEVARDVLYESFLNAARPIAEQLIAQRYGSLGNLGRFTDDDVYQSTVITIACLAAAIDYDIKRKLNSLEIFILAATALYRARRAEALASTKPSEPVY